MAITAAMTVSTATPKVGQKVACTCTVTNGGATAVNVISVQPSAVINGTTQVPGGINLGQPNLGPGMATSVPGSSGTLAINFDAVAMAPQVGTYASNPFPSSGPGMASGASNLPPEAMPQSIVYAIGAIVTTSDGAVTSATTTTLTTAAVNF